MEGGGHGAGPSVDKRRFGSSSEEEILNILGEKDSASTKRSTKACVCLLQQFVLENNYDLDIFHCSKQELNELLRRFYVDVRKVDATPYKLTSYKCLRFGLARFFKKELDMDIIHEPEFKHANAVFSAVTVHLIKGGFAKIDHHPAIEEDDLKKLYTNCKVFDVNTPAGLQRKVWFDLMFYLCRRGRENLRSMTKHTFKLSKDSKGRVYVYQYADELDKNHRENDDPNLLTTEGRMYAIPDHPLCPVSTYQKYLQKLHPKSDVLWQRPRENANISDPFWYTKGVLGVNTLSKFMKTISKEAGLSVEYTNHSIRATSITVLDSNKFESRHIMKISGHKSETSLKSYSNTISESKKQEISSALSSALMSTDSQETVCYEDNDFGVNFDLNCDMLVDSNLSLSDSDMQNFIDGKHVEINVDSNGFLSKPDKICNIPDSDVVSNVSTTCSSKNVSNNVNMM